MEFLSDPNIWAALLTLTAMEIVLGIDNLIFISVLAARLPENQQRLARGIGLGLALIFRIALLFAITSLIALTQPQFEILDRAFSWRDIILIAGGLFLLAKATIEIHEAVEGGAEDSGSAAKATFFIVIAQIVAIDAIFSVDSIVTAIGMTDYIAIMIIAVSIAMLVMFIAAEPATRFIKKHPTTKMLALAFLILIGALLVADGLGFHFPRGYVYFAMAFAVLVELLNVLARRNRRAA